MKYISPWDALEESKYVICTKDKPYHIYGLYREEDTANRVCADLNKRYNDIYEVRQITPIEKFATHTNNILVKPRVLSDC